MMVLAFVFLFGAFNSENASFSQRSAMLIKVEEHQRMEKRSAETKLLQIQQLLTTHLEQEAEEEANEDDLRINS